MTIVDIDKQPVQNFRCPVRLGQEFRYQGKRCRVVTRYTHAFDYVTPEVTPQPMEGIKRITYQFWKQELGKRIALLS